MLALTVTVLAFAGLFFQNTIDKWWQTRALKSDQAKDHSPTYGRIDSTKGNVKFRTAGTLTPKDVIVGMNLHNGDTILTEDNDSAIISFNSGLKVELAPQSTIVITDSGSEMVFLKGHVKMLDGTTSVKLPAEAIAREENISPGQGPNQGNGQPEPQVNREVPPLVDKLVPKNPPKHKEVAGSLPDAYISNVIKNQRTFLSRCYAQHLRLDPDTQGRIETSLTIETDGTVSTARVIGSTIPDPQLQQCIVATLQRAKFKSFSGDAIIVNYPINFD